MLVEVVSVVVVVVVGGGGDNGNVDGIPNYLSK